MIRKDLYCIQTQDNLSLLVFHKEFNGGFGPALSLTIYGHEFLKFDCFGEEKGHYHVYDDVTNDTIYFTEKTVMEQTVRSFYELLNNVNVYLKKSNRLNIQNFVIDMNTFTQPFEELKRKMIQYEETYYSKRRSTV